MSYSVNSEEKASPINIEAEQSVLGAAMLNNDVLQRMPNLRPEHFFDPVHARIFGMIKLRVDQGLLASPVTLASDMSNDKGLKDLGGTSYLARLGGAASLSSAAQMADFVIDLSNRRTAIAAARHLIERASQTDDLQLADALTEAMTEIENSLNDASAVPLVRSNLSVMTAAVESTNAIFNGSEPPGISTGLKVLDDAIGPLKSGRVYILAARPSMGKTAVAIGIGQSIVSAGTPVVFASLEMMEEEIAHRRQSLLLAERDQKIPYIKIENAWLSDDEFVQVVQLAREIEAQPFLTIPNQHKHLTKLRAAISSAVRVAGKTPLVIIDYLGLIKTDGRSRFDQTSEVSNAIKDMAQRLGVPILLLSQLSREVEGRDDKRPRLSDLRMSGDIEQDADVVMFVYREAYYMERNKPTDPNKVTEWQADLDVVKNVAEIIVAKQRSGPLKTVKLWVDMATNTVRDPDNNQTDMEF